MENLLQNLPDLYFLPWIGNQYQAHPLFPHKILVIGESHYCKEGPYDRNFTREWVGDSAAGHNHAFFTKISQAVAGKPKEDIERSKFWHNIAFYNYVQAMLTGPRKAPSEEEWETGKKCYYAVLNALQPDMVIILGDRFWQRFPNGTKAVEISDGQKKFPIHSYPLKENGCAYATFIWHPSTGFRWQDWHPRIKALSDYVSAQKDIQAA